MVSVLDYGASGPGSGPGRGHCVVFLGETLYSHGVPAKLMLWITLRSTSIPSRRE